MRLLVATRNPGKQPEARRILASAGIGVVFPGDVGLHEIAEEAALEATESFEGNARRKAEHFVRRSGLPTVADDSGLEVLSLGGAPGVHSRRWAGASGTAEEIDRANNAELLRCLLGASEPRRRARYRCVLVYLAHPGAVPAAFEGVCGGRILEQPRGDRGFGYDSLFWSDELGRSFAEAAPEQKDAVSHRGRALRALADALHHTIPPGPSDAPGHPAGPPRPRP